MSIHLNTGTALALIILVLLAISAAYLFTRHYYEEKILYIKKLFTAERPLSPYDRERLKEGFIFTTLWHISDIHRLAKEMHLVLDHAEAVRVVGYVIEDFRKLNGVSEFTIKMALRRLVEERFGIEEE